MLYVDCIAKEADNTLISPNVTLKFSVNDYIEYFQHCEKMSPEDISRENSIQKIAFLII